MALCSSGMYMAAITGSGDSYGSAEALSQSGAGQCDIRGVEYTAQPTNTGYVVNLRLPWHHFVNMNQFDDELAAYREFPPRVWRANFYRTNFFNSGQRNPQDFYAWSPTVANGAGASFHKPNEFGTMRCVTSPLLCFHLLGSEAESEFVVAGWWMAREAGTEGVTF